MQVESRAALHMRRPVPIALSVSGRERADNLATQHVNVQVWHFLQAVGAGVGNDAIAVSAMRLAQTLLFGDLCHGFEEVELLLGAGPPARSGRSSGRGLWE